MPGVLTAPCKRQGIHHGKKSDKICIGSWVHTSTRAPLLMLAGVLRVDTMVLRPLEA